MKPIPMSPSSLSAFNDCPFLYKAKYVDKSLPKEESPAMLRGTLIHSLMEQWIKTGKQPDNLITEPTIAGAIPAMYQNAATIPLLREAGWILHVEDSVGITIEGKATSFFAKDVWLRCKIDLWAEHPEKDFLILIDWKTGKPWSNRMQLDCNALCLTNRTEGKRIVASYAYLDLDKIYTDEIIPDIENPQAALLLGYEQSCMAETMGLIERYQKAFESDTFPRTKHRWCGRCPLPCENRK